MEIPNVNIIFRGHIRTAFDNDDLNIIMSMLKEHYNLHVFINTWSDIECTKTWRASSSLIQTKKIISEKDVYKYFTPHHDVIQKVQIQHEDVSKLHGDINGLKQTNGGLSDKCWMPKKNWKFFVQSCYESIQLVPPNFQHHITICIRLDMFSFPRLTETWRNFDRTNIPLSAFQTLDKFIRTCNFEYKYNIVRTVGGSGLGYDNALIGQYLYIHNIFKILHEHLDFVLDKHREWSPRQESIPRIVAELLVKNNNKYFHIIK